MAFNAMSECRSSFSRLLHAAEKYPHGLTGISLDTFKTQFMRYANWNTQINNHDRRWDGDLKDASHIHSQLLELLQTLDQALHDGRWQLIP